MILFTQFLFNNELPSLTLKNRTAFDGPSIDASKHKNGSNVERTDNFRPNAKPKGDRVVVLKNDSSSRTRTYLPIKWRSGERLVSRNNTMWRKCVVANVINIECLNVILGLKLI